MFKKILSVLLSVLYLSSANTGCSSYNIASKSIEKAYGDRLYTEYQNEKITEKAKGSNSAQEGAETSNTEEDAVTNEDNTDSGNNSVNAGESDAVGN